MHIIEFENKNEKNNKKRKDLFGNHSNSNYANYCFDLNLKWKKYMDCVARQ